MKVSVEHRPSYALGIIDLEAGESVRAETGAMVSMSSNIETTSGVQGGLMKSALRKMLGGESFFVNTFTAGGGRPGQVTVAPSLPGDVVEMSLEGDLYVQSGSFLAGDPGVEIDIKWGGARGFFGAEGLFLLHLRGRGDVLLSSFGAIRRVPLSDSGMVIDTGHVVAFDSTLSWTVRKVSGMLTSLISGEGLVSEFSGTGNVYLQTRSDQAFLDWLLPRLPTSRTGSGGRGDIGGIIGNVLRGQ